MCGICGALGADGIGERTKAMMEQLHHRGPDGTGFWQEDHVALGHLRLSIVDLSEDGRQPMVSTDGRIAIVVNGEIYNYRQMRSELEAKGHAFKSNCDSEVVLHAYRESGTDSFAKLDGMFAFAVWDNEKKTLYLVRDRMGIKPVYYLHDRNRFSFASEIKALLAGEGVSGWRIDPVGLHQYLQRQNTHGDRTLFRDVSILPPAHMLEIRQDDTGMSLQRRAYWSPTLSRRPENPTFEETVSSFDERLRRSVDAHLMSDVPVATYLSAGFDSTSVATAASAVVGEKLNAYTGRFPEGGWYDEFAGAQCVADAIRFPMTAVDIGATDFQANLDDVVWALDEPRMGMGALPQYLVARTAAKDRKVILTGHGGDELFSGYPVFKLALFASRLKRRSFSRLASELRYLRLSEWPHLVYFLLQRFAKGGSASYMAELFSQKDMRRGLRDEVWAAMESVHDTEGAKPELSATGDDLYARIMLNYLQVYLPGLLVVEDKISMAHSLESRTPLLSNDMVDFSLSLPQETKLHEGELKSIIKRAGRKRLPKELYAMPKRGFPTPLRHWLRGPLKDWAAERLLATDSALHVLFQPDYVSTFTRSYFSTPLRNIRVLDEVRTHKMWMLLCLESWLRGYRERLGIKLAL